MHEMNLKRFILWQCENVNKKNLLMKLIVKTIPKLDISEKTHFVKKMLFLVIL